MPKCTCECRVPVANYGMWHPMQSKDLLKENVSNGVSCLGVVDGSKVTIFGKTVYHYQDGGSTSCLLGDHQ